MLWCMILRIVSLNITILLLRYVIHENVTLVISFNLHYKQESSPA